MAPLEGPVKELDEKYAGSVVKFVTEIRSGKVVGSNKVASATVTLLEQIINDSQNATAFELCAVVREVGRRLSHALPNELVATNMVRRVLRAIRDEHRTQSHQSGEGGSSLQRLVQAAPTRRHTLRADSHDLREPLRDHISELRLELESSVSSICGVSSEHVHGDELILTCGGELVEKFLNACLERRYRLLLASTAHRVGQCHAMAARLSAAGVSVTVISNAAVGAVMSRVNKVVLDVHSVLAGGAVLCDAGTLNVTLAAAHYSVPVVVLAPLYELSPLFASDDRHAAIAQPHTAMSYGSECQGTVRVFAPLYDFIPPDHVTLFITNLGGSSPSYIYRLLSELYDPNDYQL